jgi:hypothetical protein
MTLSPFIGNFPFSQMVGLDHDPLAMFRDVDESEGGGDTAGIDIPGMSSMFDICGIDCSAVE